MVLAKARIQAGTFALIFPVNPYSAQWAYKENVQSYDTIGGRVTQLLSVNIDGLTITSVAGSRGELQKIAEGIRRIMQYHITTSRPVTFKVPSRAWSFTVYITAMPQIGWDVAATSYPFQLSMAVDEDTSGIQTHKITQSALTRLAENVGYKKGFHGGEAGAFQKLTNSVLANASSRGGTTTSGGGSTGDPVSGTGTQWQGNGRWDPKIANAPWSGKTLQDQIYNAWATTFGDKVANTMLCIAGRESGYHPEALNNYGSPIHYVYGLYQISDVHSSSSWWPNDGSVHGTEGGTMWNAEYNVRCAMSLYKAVGISPWVSTSGLCGV